MELVVFSIDIYAVNTQYKNMGYLWRNGDMTRTASLTSQTEFNAHDLIDTNFVDEEKTNSESASSKSNKKSPRNTRRRLEDKLEELRLARETREFDFDV